MNWFDEDSPGTPTAAGAQALPPCAEGLIAATLALMTGYAEHCPAPPAGDALAAAPAGRNPAVAHLLAAKAASNLAFLADLPALSAPLRSILVRLRGHWQALELRGSGAGATPAQAGVCACESVPAAPPTLYSSPSKTRH